jgi:hypothetical protein
LEGEGVGGFLVAVRELEDDEEEDDREQVEQEFHACTGSFETMLEKP